MQGIRRFLSRLITFFHSGKAESDLNREMNSHLQLLEDQFVAKGMTAEEARYAARRSFGGVEQAKEHQRDARTFPWLTGWSIDLKLGVRMMRKWPGLTLIAVFALAVGIGAGATYFEFVNDLFRPRLSFPGADRLVGLLNWDLAKGDVEDRSLYEFVDWRTQLTTVEELGAASQISEDLVAEDGRIETAQGWEISASAFRVTPVRPLYGRPLLDDDETPGAEPVIVLAEDIWRTRFNSDPQVIGRRVQTGNSLHTVVGVMPQGYGFPISSSFWTPLHFNAATIKQGEGPRVRIFGRLAPDAGVDQAQAELETLAGRANEERGAGKADARFTIHPYVESFWMDFSRSSIDTVFAIAYSSNLFMIAVLILCAANVAQLIFARATTRESEITVRTALGASRGRIMGQFVAEALVLASIAAFVGLAGASFALGQARELSPLRVLPFWWNEQLGFETLAYTALLVIIAALFIGGVPALKATGSRMDARLKAAGVGGATMRFGKVWTGVIVSQVAVTVILLMVVVSSGWTVYLANSKAGEVAFPRSEYFSGTIRLGGTTTQEREKAVRRDLQRRLNADPDVVNATFITDLPGSLDMDEVVIELAAPSGEQSSTLSVREPIPVGPNHFETFRQPLIAGRLFTGSEMDEGSNVAVVSETFVRVVFGGKSAIGQLVRESQSGPNDEPGPWLEIVGVVGDVTVTPDKTYLDAMFYRPSTPDGRWSLIVDSRSNEAAARIKAAAAATDPQIRLSVATLDKEMEASAQAAKPILTGIAIVGVVTLLLAAAGIHSMISFTLASRTREIGIRTALGAAPHRVFTSVLSPTYFKVAAGLVLGSIPGVVLVWENLDFGLSFQLVVITAVFVSGFITAVAMISCIWPIRRAFKIQPTEALRTT